MYNICQIAKNNNQKGIITGDAADELFAGYNFFLTKDFNEIDENLKAIWKVMQFPSKKIAAHFGLEVEYPFLNENVKKLAMEIPVELKIKSERNRMYGKWILRKAFEGKISKTLLWRDKTPMGDGSGSSGLTTFFDGLIGVLLLKFLIDSLYFTFTLPVSLSRFFVFLLSNFTSKISYSPSSLLSSWSN